MKAVVNLFGAVSLLVFNVVTLQTSFAGSSFPGSSFTDVKDREILKRREFLSGGVLEIYEGEDTEIISDGLLGEVGNKPVVSPPKDTPSIGLPSLPGIAGEEKDPIKEIERIINLGERIWKIIEANRPVVDAPTRSASALPNVVKSGIELENWQAPRARSYHIQYTNWYGITVVDYTFRVVYTYGGTYEGKGQYLNNVSVIPANLEVAWGYNFKSEVEVGDPVNLSTKLDPIAGMELRILWKVNTVMKHQTMSLDLFLQGDGALTVMK